MPVPLSGVYLFTIHATSSALNVDAEARLVLTCCAHSFVTVDWDDPNCPILGGGVGDPAPCGMFPICGETMPVSCGWTATAHDACDNTIVLATGIAMGCVPDVGGPVMITGDRTFTDPDGVEHDIFDETYLTWYCYVL